MRNLSISTTLLRNVTDFLICLPLPPLKVLPVRTVPVVTTELNGGPMVVTVSHVNVMATQMCATEKLADVW